ENYWRQKFLNRTLLARKHIEDWGLDDSTGKSEEEFIKTANLVEEKIKDLSNRIKKGQIKWK
ncbi:hypothetical protein G7A79_29470, partial [Coprococcus sp. MSK.21.13]|nr:hypothetical protein [Coprococcus sp. MSK.21.13]